MRSSLERKREGEKGYSRDDDAAELLADTEGADEPLTRELLARAPARVAVVEVLWRASAFGPGVIEICVDETYPHRDGDVN